MVTDFFKIGREHSALSFKVYWSFGWRKRGKLGYISDNKNCLRASIPACDLPNTNQAHKFIPQQRGGLFSRVLSARHLVQTVHLLGEDFIW